MPTKGAGQRAANGAAEAAGYGTAGDLITAVLVLLERIARSTEQTPTHVAFGGAGMEQRLENWPVARHKRIIAPARRVGAILSIPATTATDILPANPGRGGLSIINTSTNPCYIYLARAGDQSTGAAPVLWLSGSGGSWDGKVSDQLWCGEVSANAPSGAVTLALAAV